MNELEGLYQDLILDHGRKPRNFGPLSQANRTAEGFNPLCGDHFHVHLRLDGDRIVHAGFEGTGCAISTASASMMTQAVQGLDQEQAQALFQELHGLVTGEVENPDTDALGRLAALGGVRNFPLRVKCATLAWHTLRAALQGEGQPVSTE